MTWKGNHPTVTLVNQTYEKGVSLKPKEMAAFEAKVQRLSNQGQEPAFLTKRAPRVSGAFGIAVAESLMPSRVYPRLKQASKKRQCVVFRRVLK